MFDELNSGAISSKSLIFRLTDLASLTLPASSVAITAKLYSLLNSKSGSAVNETSPVTPLIVSPASLPAAKLNVILSLKSAVSSAVAV